MTECKNPLACPEYIQSYKGKLMECSGCGGDLRGTRLTSNIADRQLDKLLAHVEHNTPERMFKLTVEAAQGYKAEVEEHLPDHPVSLPEAAFALQLRSLHIINDLKEAITNVG